MDLCGPHGLGEGARCQEQGGRARGQEPSPSPAKEPAWTKHLNTQVKVCLPPALRLGPQGGARSPQGGARSPQEVCLLLVYMVERVLVVRFLVDRVLLVYLVDRVS